MAKGTSREGFDAEWRMIDIFTVDGDLISRCEIFDETDLDAALARFDELQPQAPRLENAASQVNERVLQAHFAARDWDAMAEHAGRRYFYTTIAARGERRHPTRSGWHMIEDMRCIADVGSRLRHHDGRHRHPRRASRPHSCPHTRAAAMEDAEAFHVEVLSVVEIDADDRITAAHRVRPRRHRRRHRGTRRSLPRRRSGRPRAHVDARHTRIRSTQQTPTLCDDGGLGEYRSPPTRFDRSR